MSYDVGNPALENDFDRYQKETIVTAVYPKWVSGLNGIYPALGLAGEVGEVCELIKKQIRDHDSNFDDNEFRSKLEKELGDVLWYLTRLSDDLGFSLSRIAFVNLEKLRLRKQTGKLHGEGSDR